MKRSHDREAESHPGGAAASPSSRERQGLLRHWCVFKGDQRAPRWQPEGESPFSARQAAPLLPGPNPYDTSAFTYNTLSEA